MDKQELMLECLKLANTLVSNTVDDKCREVLLAGDRLFQKIVSIDSRNLLPTQNQESTVIADVNLADTQKRRGRPPKA